MRSVAHQAVDAGFVEGSSTGQGFLTSRGSPSRCENREYLLGLAHDFRANSVTGKNGDFSFSNFRGGTGRVARRESRSRIRLRLTPRFY